MPGFSSLTMLKKMTHSGLVSHDHSIATCTLLAHSVMSLVISLRRSVRSLPVSCHSYDLCRMKATSKTQYQMLTCSSLRQGLDNSTLQNQINHSSCRSRCNVVAIIPCHARPASNMLLGLITLHSILRLRPPAIIF
jgi:hypothetical protein